MTQLKKILIEKREKFKSKLPKEIRSKINKKFNNNKNSNLLRSVTVIQGPIILEVDQELVDSWTFPVTLDFTNGAILLRLLENINIASKEIFIIKNQTITDFTFTLEGNAQQIRVNGGYGLIYDIFDENTNYYGNSNFYNCGIIDISNIGIEDYFAYYNSISAGTTSFYNCYVSGIINNNSSGFINSSDSINTFINCYALVDKGNSNFISSFTDFSSNDYFFNCYSLSSTINKGMSFVYVVSDNDIEVGAYFSNCYNNYSKLVEITDFSNYAVNNNGYLFTNWDDSQALVQETLTKTYFTNSSNWTIYGSGISVLGDLNFLWTSNFQGNSSESFINYQNNTPWGLIRFSQAPWKASTYTNARSLANCFCKGTKITTINYLGKEEKVNIEDMRTGMVVKTPFKGNKKVLHVGRILYTKHHSNNELNPVMIPKDFFLPCVPSEDTYLSGLHNIIYDIKQSELLGLQNGRDTEEEFVKKYPALYLGEEKSVDQVAVLKGENPYEFYYYHLVIEDNAGFFANNLQSESISKKKFMRNFEEINKESELEKK